MLLFCFLVVSLLQIQQLNAVALRKIRAGDSIVLRPFLFKLIKRFTDDSCGILLVVQPAVVFA